MFRLLEIEFRKLLPYRSFWAAILGYTLLLVGLFISLYRFKFNLNSFEIGINFYNFPDIWHNITYISSWFNILLYFFVILIITNEFQFRTLRQNVIDGQSRFEMLLGKALLLMVFVLASTALVALLSILCGLFLAEEGMGTPSTEKMEYLAWYLVQTTGMMSLALLIATLFRKQGMSIIVYLGYTLIVEAILRYRVVPEDWGPYLPVYLLSGLVPNPLPAYFGMGTIAPTEPLKVGVALLYALIFFGISVLVLYRRDL